MPVQALIPEQELSLVAISWAGDGRAQLLVLEQQHPWLDAAPGFLIYPSGREEAAWRSLPDARRHQLHSNRAAGRTYLNTFAGQCYWYELQGEPPHE